MANVDWDDLDKWLEAAWRSNWNPRLQRHIKDLQAFARERRTEYDNLKAENAALRERLDRLLRGKAGR